MKELTYMVALLLPFAANSSELCSKLFYFENAHYVSLLDFPEIATSSAKPKMIDMIAATSRLALNDHEDLLVTATDSLVLSNKKLGNFEMIIEKLQAPMSQGQKLMISPDKRMLLIYDNFEIHVYDLKTRSKISSVAASKFRNSIQEFRFISDYSVVIRYAFGNLTKVNLLQPESRIDLQVGDFKNLSIFNGVSMAQTKSGSLLVLSHIKDETSASKTVVDIIDPASLKKIGALSLDGIEGTLIKIINSDKNELFYISRTGQSNQVIIQNVNRAVVKRIEIPTGYFIESATQGASPIRIENDRIFISAVQSTNQSSQTAAIQLARTAGVTIVLPSTPQPILKFEIPL